MKLYRSRNRFVVEHQNHFSEIADSSWDELITREDLADHLSRLVPQASRIDPPSAQDLLAPIGSQEVWAAGVTYYRSRDARMEESKSAGGGDFYDRVYSAQRPELFFKGTPHRVVGPGQKMAIRSDTS